MPRSTEQEWRWQITQSQLPPNARHVAHTLALSMNPDGSNAKIGIRSLMNRTGYAFNTVREGLQILEDDKWLAVTKPAAGTRPATYAANIPPDIWAEIVIEQPSEVMRRDRTADHASDAVIESLRALVTQPLSHNDAEPPTYPQDPSSDAVVESQAQNGPDASDAVTASLRAVAFSQRFASDAVTASDLDLDLNTTPLSTSYNTARDQPRGGSDSVPSDEEPKPEPSDNPTENIQADVAPGYRDPDIWAEAGRVARQANPTNIVAYRQAVYTRLQNEQRATHNMHRALTDIEHCNLCSASGMIETDTGFVRCTHPTGDPT